MKFAFRILTCCVLVITAMHARDAHAICSSPSGSTGDMVYNTNYSVPQYCDGSNWIAMVGGDPGTPSSTTQTVPSGLIGHWRLDETTGTTATDSSGNGLGGTFSGSTFASNTRSGVVKNSSYFDNTNDQINIGNIAALDMGTSDLSYSVWVKPEQSGAIIGKRTNSTGGDGYDLRYDIATQKFLAVMGGNSSSSYITTSNMTVIPDVWYQVIVNIDRDGLMSMYINGSLDSSVSISAENGVNITSTENFYIGGNSDAGDVFFGGSVDDVRIYNRLLTAIEIDEIYKAHDGIRYNPNYRTMEYFDQNKWVSMTRSWTEVGDAPILSYLDSSCTTIGQVCSNGSIYAGTSPDGNLPMYTTPADAGSMTWNDGTTNWLDTALVNCSALGDPGESCDTGQGNTTFLVGLSGSGTPAPYVAAEYCDSLTAHGYSDWYLPALNEINEIYTNQGAIGGFSATDYWSSSERSNNNGRSFDFGSGNTSNRSKDQSYQIRCVRKPTTEYVTNMGGLVGHWKLDETTGTTAYDSTSNGSDGTMMNGLDGANDSAPGTVGKGLNFDGIDDYVALPASTLLNNAPEATMCAWIKPASITADMAVISWDWNADNRLLLFVDDVFGAHVDTMSLFIQTTPYPGERVVGPTNTVEVGKWQHFCGVFDGGNTLSLYKNGALLNQAVTTNPTLEPTQSIKNVSIGRAFSAGGNRYFNGDIDDIRVYNRVLSDTEIQTLYQMGAPIGSSTALPQSCPNIGDVCDDGTIYVGLSPDGSVEMYAAQDQQFLPWNNGTTDYTETFTANNTTGEANTNSIVTIDSDAVDPGFQIHQAAQYCYDLVMHGSDDWYLPALDELRLNVIPNLYPGGHLNITTYTGYWSSSERGGGFIDGASIRYIDVDGSTSAGWYPKQSDRWARCVRKGPAPRCANPYGLEGSMIYNSSDDVMQYCDGARWIAIGKMN